MLAWSTDCRASIAAGLRRSRRRSLRLGEHPLDIALAKLLARPTSESIPRATWSSLSETRIRVRRSRRGHMLPLDEIELAEQHFLEQRLAQGAVGFL